MSRDDYFWRGKRLEDMTHEELEKALADLAKLHRSDSDRYARQLKDLRGAPSKRYPDGILGGAAEMLGFVAAFSIGLFCMAGAVVGLLAWWVL